MKCARQRKDDPNKAIKVMTEVAKEYEPVKISERGKLNRGGTEKGKINKSSSSKFPK